MADAAYTGTYCIPLHQMRVEGLPAGDLDDLQIGAAWEWHGQARRLDGPDSILRLGSAVGEARFRQRVASACRKRRRGARDTTNRDEVEVQLPLDDSGFVVANGVQRFLASFVFAGAGCTPLAVFYDGLPARGTEFWISERPARPRPVEGNAAGSLVCFSSHTLIDTPDGPRRACDLRPGDPVCTKDNGPQPLLWTGARHVSGVRMQALPWMRPVLIRSGALSGGRPDQDLLVSRRHRIMVSHRSARELFGEPDVLVEADHLVDGCGVLDICPPEGVTYCHLMLPGHEILFANGIEAESFHPADADANLLDPELRARLSEVLPDFRGGLHDGYARRTVTRSEAALLMHVA